MIVSPKGPGELQACQGFMLHYAGVSPSADARYIGWVEADDLKIVVCFNAFLGKVCQMHVAMKPDFRFSPRSMLRECFRYAFIKAEREMVLGIVNSMNEEAMRYDAHLGFKELFRIPKLHEEGGDIVVFGMKKDDCRWLHLADTPQTPPEAVAATH